MFYLNAYSNSGLHWFHWFFQQGEDIEGGASEQAWSKWSNDGTEQQVAKLMEEDVGAAM